MALTTTEKNIIIGKFLYSVLIGIACGTIVYFLMGAPSGVQL